MGDAGPRQRTSGFRLLGFKPASTVPEENLKPALFIYPEEGVVQGSTTAFAALHAKMLELNRVAVVRGVMRERGDTPKLFLLVPVVCCGLRVAFNPLTRAQHVRICCAACMSREAQTQQTVVISQKECMPFRCLLQTT